MCLQEYDITFKHAQFLKLLPAGTTIDSFDLLKNDAEQFNKFLADLKTKTVPCRLFIWCDPEDEDRVTLSVYPDEDVKV